MSCREIRAEESLPDKDEKKKSFDWGIVLDKDGRISRIKRWSWADKSTELGDNIGAVLLRINAVHIFEASDLTKAYESITSGESISFTLLQVFASTWFVFINVVLFEKVLECTLLNVFFFSIFVFCNVVRREDSGSFSWSPDWTSRWPGYTEKIARQKFETHIYTASNYFLFSTKFWYCDVLMI